MKKNNLGLRILVVDDEILIARNLQQTLIDLGNDVPEVASSAQDAIELVEKLRPELVFMDIRLASGMDGIEAAGIIKDRYNVPVIFLTAYADEETLSRAREVAPYGYLIKPVAERDIKIITEVAMGRRHAELLLLQSESKNQMILDSTFDAFVGMDDAGLITGWNRQAEITFGWSPQEAIGRSLSDTIIPERFRYDHSKGLTKFLKTGLGPVLGKRLEMNALHKKGHEFPVEMTISFIHWENKYSFHAFIHDISERKKAESALKESRVALQKINEELETKVKERTIQLEKANFELAASNAQLDQFAAVAAHDLRAPMKSMHNWVDMLDIFLPKPRTEEVENAIVNIRENSKKAKQLINDLLEVARVNKSNTRFESINLNETIKSILIFLQEDIENSQAEISLENLPTILGNSIHLESVFTNLIRNALTYRNKDRATKIFIGCKEHPENYEFSIRDNGIGIPVEFRHRIFEMFKRLHKESEFPGSGIGLAFCKKVVELAGGKIWVTSVPDEGSTFFFTYPKKIKEVA